MEGYNYEAFKSVVGNIIKRLLVVLLFTSNFTITHILINLFENLQPYRNIIFLVLTLILLIILIYPFRQYKLSSIFTILCITSVYIINYLKIQHSSLIIRILIVIFIIFFPYLERKDMNKKD